MEGSTFHETPNIDALANSGMHFENGYAAKHPEKVTVLRQRLDAWLAETGVRIPRPDPRYNAERKKKQMQQMRDKRMPALERQAETYLDPDWKPNADWWNSATGD